MTRHHLVDISKDLLELRHGVEKTLEANWFRITYVLGTEA